MPPPHYSGTGNIATIMNAITAGLTMVMAGVGLLEHDASLAPSIPADIIDDMVRESLDQYILPEAASKRRHGSSGTSGGPKKKRKNVKYDRERARRCVMSDWLGPVPRFADKQFERVFRITREHAEFLLTNLANHDDFWTTTFDRKRQPSICPKVKFLAAQKRLCYGISFSGFQDYFQMGESTARLCVSHLARGIVECPEISDVYLHSLTKQDARNVVAMHKEQHGIDGMLGSLDVMKVPWGNCPTAWKGQFEGKEGHPTIGLEAVVDYNLWFWHDALGFPGALNDINIWERSPLFESFQDGTFEELDFDYVINGECFSELFVLVDGIYPHLSRFLQAITEPTIKIDKYFTGWQESKRKDVEQGFGVLQKKFHFLVHDIQLHDREDIFYAVRACIAMHNMMVEARVKEDQQEESSFYELVTSETSGEASVPGRAEAEVDAEDAMLEENKCVIDQNQDIIDLDFKRKWERSQFMPRKLRIVQRRWATLYNAEAHNRLRNAVKQQLYTERFGKHNDGEELVGFDSL